ncbi:MBL fold metallo-hydrolase [Burkholderia sp. Bp9002]|nr:MBL fold metallo-hydrolase [Burkholderia sp. Bp9002]
MLYLPYSGIRRERARSLVAFAAALLTLLLLANTISAQAKAPMVGTQGPGFYRIMVGKYEVTALLDGTHPFPIDTVMTNVPRTEIERDLASDDLKPPVQGSINAFLINTGEQLVLIDAGAGALYGGCCGRLLTNLRAAGYQPDQVDQVLLTHLHKDHVGGVALDGKMAFPNAIVRVPQRDDAYWTNLDNKRKAPAFLSSFFDSAAESLAPYAAAGRIKTFGDSGELAPGIRAVATPGHTPGHTSYVVESDGQTLLVWGDIIHVAAIQLRDPEASVEYDSVASDARKSRRSLMKTAADNHYLVAAAHISFPGLGHLSTDGRGYRWIPVNYDADPANTGKIVTPASDQARKGKGL